MMNFRIELKNETFVVTDDYFDYMSFTKTFAEAIYDGKLSIYDFEPILILEDGSEWVDDDFVDEIRRIIADWEFQTMLADNFYSESFDGFNSYDDFCSWRNS